MAGGRPRSGCRAPGLRVAAALGLGLLAAVAAPARTVEHPAGFTVEIPGSWQERIEGRRLFLVSADGGLAGSIGTPIDPGLADRGRVVHLLGLVDSSRGPLPASLHPDLAPGRAALAAELAGSLEGVRLGRTWLSSRAPVGLEALGHAIAAGRPVALEAGLLATARPLVYEFHAEAGVLNLRLTQIGELVASLKVGEPPAGPARGIEARGLAARVARLRSRTGGGE